MSKPSDKRRKKAKKREVEKKGQMHSIAGKLKEKQEFQARVEAGIKDHEERLVRVEVAYRELVRANNSATVLLAAIESFLDNEHGKGWDDGIRDEVKKRTELAVKLKQAYVTAAKKDIRPHERVQLAEEIDEVSTELGLFDQHALMILHQYSKADRRDRIAKTVDRIEKEKVKVSPELGALINQYKDMMAKKENLEDAVASPKEPKPKVPKSK